MFPCLLSFLAVALWLLRAPAGHPGISLFFPFRDLRVTPPSGPPHPRAARAPHYLWARLNPLKGYSEPFPNQLQPLLSELILPHICSRNIYGAFVRSTRAKQVTSGLCFKGGRCIQHIETAQNRLVNGEAPVTLGVYEKGASGFSPGIRKREYLSQGSGSHGFHLELPPSSHLI